MRSSLLVSAVASAVLLAACSGGPEPIEEAAPSPTETVIETPDEEPTEEASEPEGEGRDPDARYGEDVCTALLPALDGETDGLDRYATDEVLDVLLLDDSADPLAPLAEVHSEDGSECEIAIGDAWVVLTLEGDGHVGHRAVSAVWSTSYPQVEPADPAAVAEAVRSIRGTDAVCDGQAADLPEGAGDHIIYELPAGTVIAIVCETFAYQSTFDLRGWDGTGLTTLTAEQWQGGGVEYSSMFLGSPSLEAGQFRNLEKARGLGDCGILSTWFFDGDFLGLAEVRERPCDDGAEPADPMDWPLVYPVD